MTPSIPRKHKDRRHLEEDASQWAGKLVARFVAAGSSEERMQVLAEMDRRLPLDEDAALALYRVDAGLASSFLERHLPPGRRTQDVQPAWLRLMELASARRDDPLYFALYRRQATAEQWLQDTSTLAGSELSTGALCAELSRRHPQRWRPDIGPHLITLARTRGEAVLPYLQQHAEMVWSRQRRGGYDEILELARTRGWWELWSTLVRISASAGDYDREVHVLAADRNLTDSECIHRLMLLAGVNAQAGSTRLRMMPLREETILALHERFPHLVTGPFRDQLQPGPRRPLTGVLELAIRVKDRELIDQLSARLAVRADRSGADQLLQAASYAAQYLESADPPPEGERRAVGILRRLPRRAINNQRELMLRNPLARLLFERAARACEQNPHDVDVLLQAQERHVCALAVDALTRTSRQTQARIADDPQVLLHALERPLPRPVIHRALIMLESVAADAFQAAHVLRWARDKLEHQHPRFSRSLLLELVARLLARFEGLRLPNEQPLVYRRRTT